MSFQMFEKRCAHDHGVTHCCYTKDGRSIITCGSDGMIRIWSGINDQEPVEHMVGEYALAVTHNTRHMFVSNDMNAVQAFSYPRGDHDATKLKFRAPVTSIRVSDKYIVAGSEDWTIKVTTRKKPYQPFELIGHDGPILSMDLHSQKDWLASGGGDGTIRVWDLRKKAQITCIRRLVRTRSYFLAKSYITPRFEPVYGKSMAYCHVAKVVILDTVNFQKKVELRHRSNCWFTVCRYSTTGTYLAAGTMTGEISLWHIRSGETLHVVTNFELLPQSITWIEWNPSTPHHELVYTDSSGLLGIVTFVNKVIDETVSDEAILTSRIECQDDQRRSATPFHPPFQPGEIPTSSERRVMLWNSVGLVRHHSDSSIVVEFHDASVHHAIHIQHHRHYTMASLSTTVVALSCNTPSKLVCVTLGADSHEWCISMAEKIVAIVATDKIVAVACDDRQIRLYTVMGDERDVVNIPGPALTISGHQNKVIVVYHSARTTDELHISAFAIRVNGHGVVCKDTRVPMSPGANLAWFGCTERGSPVLADSKGIVKYYHRKQNYWMVICDTTKHAQQASDSHFVVGVCEESKKVRTIVCRGGSAYPAALPNPVVHELSIPQVIAARMGAALVRDEKRDRPVSPLIAPKRIHKRTRNV